MISDFIKISSTAHPHFIVPNNDNNFVARVDDYYLTQSELNDQIPENISEADSTKLIKNIIEKWAINKLLMKNAQLNMTDEEKISIENITNSYKENLIINLYKNKISYNNTDTLINDEDVKSFYKINAKNFKLYDEIIKGRYVKLNKNNFNINEIKRRFNRFNLNDKIFFDSISIFRFCPSTTNKGKIRSDGCNHVSRIISLMESVFRFRLGRDKIFWLVISFHPAIN